MLLNAGWYSPLLASSGTSVPPGPTTRHRYGSPVVSTRQAAFAPAGLTSSSGRTGSKSAGGLPDRMLFFFRSKTRHSPAPHLLGCAGGLARLSFQARYGILLFLSGFDRATPHRHEPGL